MKKFMVAGGGLGFLIGLVSGLMQQAPWPSVLWRSSAAALVAGLLLRWWAGIWVRSCQQIAQAHQPTTNQPGALKPTPAHSGRH
jgi:hypothetical protein